MSDTLLTPERLAELRRVAQAATFGQWFYDHSESFLIFHEAGAACIAEVQGGTLPDPTGENNAAHIVAFSPVQGVALIDEIERLRLALEVRDKVLALLNAVYESTCENSDRLKQENRRLQHQHDYDAERIADGEQTIAYLTERADNLANELAARHAEIAALAKERDTLSRENDELRDHITYLNMPLEQT